MWIELRRRQRNDTPPARERNKLCDRIQSRGGDSGGGWEIRYSSEVVAARDRRVNTVVEGGGVRQSPCT